MILKGKRCESWCIYNIGLADWATVSPPELPMPLIYLALDAHML